MEVVVEVVEAEIAGVAVAVAVVVVVAIAVAADFQPRNVGRREVTAAFLFRRTCRDSGSIGDRPPS